MFVRALFVALAAAALVAALAPEGQAAGAGSLDPSFADDGRKLTDFFGRGDRAEAVAIQADGRIVVAGGVQKPKLGTRMALTRYRRDGRLDRSFGGDGRTTVRRWDSFVSSQADAVAIQENGKIVAAGTTAVDLAVARFRRNGELDRSFGDGGKVHIDLWGVNQAEDVAVQSDGKIVVVGHTHGADGTPHQLVIARFLRDGSPDPSFGDGGALLTRFGQDAFVLGYGVALQPDGKIVVSGEVGGFWILARFLSDGSPDTGFGNDEGVQHTLPLAFGEPHDVALQADGKIVAAGTDVGGEGVAFGVARYLPDGSPDPSFGDAGAVHTNFGRPALGDFGSALALQPNGKLAVAGTTTVRAPIAGGRKRARFALARYLPDGELDPSFADDGRATTGFPRPKRRDHDAVGESVAIQANGRIVLAGYSQPFREDADFAVARYLGGASD